MRHPCVFGRHNILRAGHPVRQRRAGSLLDVLEPRVLLTVYNVSPGNLIQPVIDAATSGDTIHIAVGTYVEQLIINGKNLTLTGDDAGGGTYIEAPATLATSFTTSTANKAVITFMNLSQGDISHITIDGLGQGNANARFIGLAYRNAGGTADRVAIRNITDTPLDMAQGGIGLYAYDDNGSPNTVTLSNSAVYNYQKAGISLSGADLTANVLSSTITGLGPTNQLAQYGVQFSLNASGLVSGNLITANQYNGTQGIQGDAILITQPSGFVSVEGNSIAQNDGGIVAQSTVTIHQNVVTSNTLGIELFGPQTGSSITNNVISGSQYGIYFDAGLAQSIPVNDNSIFGDTAYALVNASGIAIDARNNWWGSAAGPTISTPINGDYVFGPMTYAPWLLNGVDGSSATGFQPTDPIAGRYVFYNDSAFDGNNAAANAADDGAIAPDKTALLPGAAASFANYTSYSNGINGIMVDVLNLAHSSQVGAGDFVLKTGTTGNPSTWSPAPAPASVLVLVRAGQGAGGADRVEIVWSDASAVKNAWLQVTLLADAHTGLAANDVFYFGNAVGETGDNPANAEVNAVDEIGARAFAADLTGGLSADALRNVYDFNRDRVVNAGDEAIAGANYTNVFTALPLITAPGGAVAAGAFASQAVPAILAAAPIVPRAVSPVLDAPPATLPANHSSTTDIPLVREPTPKKRVSHTPAAPSVATHHAGNGLKKSRFWKLADLFS